MIVLQVLVSLNHDAAGTSDDSGRASERLNGPIAARDRDSSHDRLSDVSYFSVMFMFGPSCTTMYYENHFTVQNLHLL